MRYIRTSNNYVEFIEADKDEQILSVRGFQFGELYFQIKNGKVTFYLNDQENPWRNDVWTLNIPFELDGVLYDNEDDASAALHSIMNDSFQEQLDELKEGLAAEEARAQAVEEALGEEIDDEVERAISAETHLQTEITELSGAVSNIDARVTRNTNDISALTDTVNDEIARSVAKDAEHDALISGLTNGLNNEIQRAISAETNLHNEILAEADRAQLAESGITANLNAEIQNRIADVDAEEARALAAESALTNAINAEISRSTAKDAEHDALISGLSTSLQNEINRAVGAENTLRNDLNNEISARTASDNTQNQRITALEVGKADANNVYTKAESDAKYATKEYVSGNTYTKAEITTMLADKADKVNAVSTALYNSQSKTIDLKNIYGNVVASIDARDFIKDGMVDNVVISNNNLVITFNTDAGKEDIVVPLTNIFDPTNYYNKTEIDNIVNNIESGITQDLTNYYNKTEIDNIVNNIESGITQDLTNYYTKSEVDASQLVQDNKINAISGDVQTLSGEVQTISGSAITSGEVQTMINNSISGKTIDYLSAGTNVTISNNVISATDTKYTAGRAIDITSNVVSLDLPISAGTGSDSIIENSSANKAISNNSHAEGYQTAAGGSASHVEGTNSKTSGNSAHAEGYETRAIGEHSHSEGRFTTARGMASHAEGYGTDTTGNYEHASGYVNKSYRYSTSVFGHSGNTLFTIGNSEVKNVHTDYEKHNAFEVRENGNIYIPDTSQITGSGSGQTQGHNFYDAPMICLQDALATAMGSGVTSGQVQTMIDNSLVGYQETLSAGTNVQINNNVISATDTTYSAGDGISISNQNVISTVTKFWCGTQAQYDAITTKDPNTVYMIHE